MSFSELGLLPAVLRALNERGYETPTPIQAQAIPQVLAGHDLLAAAQTGTGKTAGFALPIITKLFEQSDARSAQKAPRVLVLTPTRELAAQVFESFKTYGQYLPLRATTIFGGVSMGPQFDALRRGLDVLIATPGRLLDHMGQRSVDLSQVTTLVLDEADRMLDMGFLPALKRVLVALPRQRQTLMFSATFSDEIKTLAAQFLKQPKEVSVTPRNTIAETIQHLVHPVDTAKKRNLLIELMAKDSRRQTLVFSRTKHGANKLAEILEKSGFKAAAIHGNKSQNARTKALADFKNGRVHVLVATDIAARGLDIPQLPVVINFDLPMVAEDYVHRIGRTGRAGETGQAISLVSPDESGLLRDIQRMLKQEIATEVIAGFEPSQALRFDANAPRPTPGSQRQNRGGQNQGRAPQRGGQTPQGQDARRGSGQGKPHHGKPQHGKATQNTGAASPGQRRRRRGSQSGMQRTQA